MAKKIMRKVPKWYLVTATGDRIDVKYPKADREGARAKILAKFGKKRLPSGSSLERV